MDNNLKEKDWGKSIVEILEKELKREFTDVQGFLEKIFGECEIYILNIKIVKFCHH